MANLDDVISELRIAIKDFTENQLVYETGDDNVIISITTLEQALALLEAQEPRVMTLEEIKAWDGAVLVEYRGTFGQTIMEWLLYMAEESRYICFANHKRTSVIFEKCDYIKGWRCWTSRPTDEQRKATCWEHNILTQKENENG